VCFLLHVRLPSAIAVVGVGCNPQLDGTTGRQVRFILSLHEKPGSEPARFRSGSICPSLRRVLDHGSDPANFRLGGA
jgi:hypothetical protein